MAVTRSVGGQLECGGQRINGLQHDDIRLIAGEDVEMLAVDSRQSADIRCDVRRYKLMQPAGAIAETQAVIKNPLQHAVEGPAVPADALPGALVGVMSSEQRDHCPDHTPRGRTTAGGGRQSKPFSAPPDRNAVGVSFTNPVG